VSGGLYPTYFSSNPHNPFIGRLEGVATLSFLGAAASDNEASVLLSCEMSGRVMVLSNSPS